MKKRLARKKSIKLHDWIIKNHAALNGKHDEFLAEGYVFATDKTRFWVCKDGTVTVRLVYKKTGNFTWREEHVLLLKIHISAKQITVRGMACNSNLFWSGKFRKAAKDDRL